MSHRKSRVKKLAPDMVDHPFYSQAVHLAHLVYAAITAIENGTYKHPPSFEMELAQKHYKQEFAALEECTNPDTLGFIAQSAYEAGARIVYIRIMEKLGERRRAIEALEREKALNHRL